MGGSYTSPSARRFVESAEREGAESIGRMRKVYSVDPTPALKERIERAAQSHERRMKTLRAAFERFERTMGPSDDELRAANSSERGEPVFGDPELVRKKAQRKMGEAEYDDLVNGPDVIQPNFVSKDDKK